MACFEALVLWYNDVAHCNTLKPHLFAAFPSLLPFFSILLHFACKKMTSELINGGERVQKKASWVNKIYYNEVKLIK